MMESFSAQLRNLETPVFLMSGDRDEGQVAGSLRAGPLPPGRGRLVHRDGVALVQSAYVPT
jgi:S-DNA-T family DNA segregation ATPase FtsK/SpoIIIE